MGIIGSSEHESVVYNPSLLVKDHQQNAEVKHRLREIYSENVVAKITRAASDFLKDNDPPLQYPETVPQCGPNKGRWESREVDFWTCGFFPGCIYSLLETFIKHPEKFGLSKGREPPLLVAKLSELGRQWSDPIRTQALRTDTHDLGFVIMPHMRPRWELFHETDALDTILQAADSLGKRFDSRVQAIRSWDTFDWHDEVRITSMHDNFLVIIDSMCNMDLLFYAAAQSGNEALANMAVSHSRTLLRSHLRKESATRNGYSGVLYSTPHLVNFDPATGSIKEVRTARDAACGLAEYFLLRLEEAPGCVERPLRGGKGRHTGRYVPLWDFDGPIEDPENPLRDVSAGVIAANGMLILSQAFSGQKEYKMSARYLESAIRIVEDTLDFSLAPEKAQFTVLEGNDLSVRDMDVGLRFDAILKHSTVCYNAKSFKGNKGSDHGLVYADYYLLEFGNRLLRMGIL